MTPDEVDVFVSKFINSAQTRLGYTKRIDAGEVDTDLRPLLTPLLRERDRLKEALKILQAIVEVTGVDIEGNYSGTPAFNALMENTKVRLVLDDWEKIAVAQSEYCADCGKKIIPCTPEPLYQKSSTMVNHMHKHNNEKWCDGNSSRYAHPREWKPSDPIEDLREAFKQ